jgi:hypothetical protein
VCARQVRRAGAAVWSAAHSSRYIVLHDNYRALVVRITSSQSVIRWVILAGHTMRYFLTWKRTYFKKTFCSILLVT